MIGLASFGVTQESVWRLAGDCLFYTAQLVAQYPDHQTVVWGRLNYFCDVEQGCDDGFTYFTVANREYRVQKPNVHQVAFNQTTCQVLIVYDADKLFRGDFQ